MTLPTGANIVVNGDFETVTNADDNFFLPAEVDGWQTLGTETQLNIFNNQNFGNVLDLDSTAAEFDRVYQDVGTLADTEYLVTFDFRKNQAGPNDASAQSYDFEVWWNGELIETYQSGDYWQTGSIRVTSSSNLTTQLLFCEVVESGQPQGGDGVGALLDNIRVMQAIEVTPENASFETVTGDGGTNGIFYRPYEVAGWGAMSADFADRWLKINSSGESVSATNGDRYLNLDTTDQVRNIAYRDVTTVDGTTYYVTFDMRIDGETDDEMRVRWNENWAGTLRGTHDWQNYGFMLTAEASTTRLTFLEPDAGDGSGPLIDNVRIFAVQSNPIVVDLNGAQAGQDTEVTYVPGTGPVKLISDIELSHPTSDRVSSVTVTLGGAADGSSELIAVSEANIPLDENDEPKITSFHYETSTRQLQLVGEATLAEYALVLRSLSYFNNADPITTTDRTVTVTVTNDELPLLSSSSEATATVSIETNQEAIDDAILQKFIADNDLDVQSFSSGLYAVIDDPGTGDTPDINSSVRVAYTGRFLTRNSQNQIVEGEVFDSSSAAGVTFPLTNVIEGWQQGIPLFSEGGTGKLLIPSDLGYGSNDGFGIPANSILIFDIELLEVV